MFTLLNVVGITLKLENAFFEKKKQSQNIPEIFTHTFAAK